MTADRFPPADSPETRTPLAISKEILSALARAYVKEKTLDTDTTQRSLHIINYPFQAGISIIYGCGERVLRSKTIGNSNTCDS